MRRGTAAQDRPPRPGRMRLVTTTGKDAGRRAESVRWARVRAARARIASGYYERLEVREAVVGALLDELTRE